jgi:hypothetical protein
MKMSKKLKKCDWCKKDKKDIINSYFAMSPIQPKFEKQIANAIQKYGPEWWVGLEKDDKDKFNDLSFYDQLTCTVGKGMVCRDCMIKDDQDYAKYRNITDDLPKDEFEMMKIISDDKIEDIDECEEWFGNIKEKISKPKVKKFKDKE